MLTNTVTSQSGLPKYTISWDQEKNLEIQHWHQNKTKFWFMGHCLRQNTGTKELHRNFQGPAVLCQAIVSHPPLNHNINRWCWILRKYLLIQNKPFITWIICNSTTYDHICCECNPSFRLCHLCLKGKVLYELKQGITLLTHNQDTTVGSLQITLEKQTAREKIYLNDPSMQCSHIQWPIM